MLGILHFVLTGITDRQSLQGPLLAGVREVIAMYRRKEQGVRIDTLCDRGNRIRYRPESFQALHFSRIILSK